MFLMIGLMVTGVLIGLLLPQQRLKKISHPITLLIWLLLFLLGVEAGSNENVMSQLHTLGLEALLIMIGGVFGSAVAAAILWRWTLKKREGKR